MDGKIQFGVTKTGKPLTLDLLSSAGVRIMLTGASGSGKSVMIFNLALLMAKELREHIQFVAIDPKLAGLLPLEKRLCYPIVTEPQDFLPTFMRLDELMNARLVYCKEHGLSNLDYKNPEILERFPIVCIIVDELLSITNNPDLDKGTIQSIKDWFTTFLTRCRAVGFFAIIASHNWSERDAITVPARSQLQQRILMRCDKNTANICSEGMIDICKPHQLSEAPGQFYFSSGDYMTWFKGVTFYTPDEKAKSVASAYSNDIRDIGLGWSMASPL